MKTLNIFSLNPYSNGTPIELLKKMKTFKYMFVLILILMEHR